jgi:hypothetical protein
MHPGTGSLVVFLFKNAQFGPCVQMTAAVKAQLKTLEASAAAATAAVEERLKDQAQCTASALLAASDVAKCQMAERDLWHAARDTFLERLLSEWRVSSRQVFIVYTALIH